MFPEHVRHAIIGTGFAGLGMAIRLQQEGRSDFVVLERGDDVGGTWRDNHYPGAACDVPSRLYSFSFARNPRWSHSFSPQPEILDYLRGCADRFGVRDRIHFGCTVERATWLEDERRWHLQTTSGELTADVLVSGAGALSEPRLPDIEGRDAFAGPMMHSAAWDHDVPLEGKRIAVVGTGASAIQIVPELQPVAARLTVFQRTPAWVIPRNDRPFPKAERALYSRFPRLEGLARDVIYWAREGQVVAFAKRPGIMRALEVLARAHLRRQVKDPVKREKLTPSYRIGCKRILLSNDFWRALDRPNADVVTEGIERITPRGIVTRDGVEHEVDVIVFATGFQVTPPPIARAVVGRGGETLAARWEREGMKGHRGTTFPGFPNLFQLVGPNTGLGHTSMVVMIEAQIEYVLDALRTMERERVAAVEPRREAMAAWNAELKRRLDGTVWHTGGCSSWYLDQHGENVTLWPDFTFRFRAATRRFDREAYDAVPARERVAA